MSIETTYRLFWMEFKRQYYNKVINAHGQRQLMAVSCSSCLPLQTWESGYRCQGHAFLGLLYFLQLQVRRFGFSAVFLVIITWDWFLAVPCWVCRILYSYYYIGVVLLGAQVLFRKVGPFTWPGGGGRCHTRLLQFERVRLCGRTVALKDVALWEFEFCRKSSQPEDGERSVSWVFIQLLLSLRAVACAF